jgi:hypothetical protein
VTAKQIGLGEKFGLLSESIVLGDKVIDALDAQKIIKETGNERS